MDYLQTSLTSLPVDRGEREATSKAFRRRSSTSDALRFREKLQELSCSADMHDDMMGESPREYAEQDSSSPHETVVVNEVATNTNSNNNSPVDTVNLREGEKYHQTTSLFSARFRSHVRASSDTTTITYTKASATSKLTEARASAKDATPTTSRREKTTPAINPDLETVIILRAQTSPNGERRVSSRETIPVPVPRESAEKPIPKVNILNGTTEKGLPPAPVGLIALTVPREAQKHSKSLDSDGVESADSDRKSTIVDIGYDL